MRSAILYVTLVICCSSAWMAQAQDFIVRGRVQDSYGNLAQQYPLEIKALQIGYSHQVYTDSLGFFSDTIAGASIPGQHVDFRISIYDPCALIPLSIDTISNKLGTRSQTWVDIELCFVTSPSNGQGTCNATFSYQTDPALISATFIPYLIDTSLSYLWSFGDGDSSTLANPTHIYPDSGTWFTELSVTRYDYLGTVICTDHWGIFIDIANSSANQTCSSSFIAVPNPADSLNWQFYSTAHYGAKISYLWDFGDGDTSHQQNPSHLYSNSGTYFACLSIFDKDSLGNIQCGDSYCSPVTATHNSNGNTCLANFTHTDNGSGTISFQAQSSGNSFLWDFGDGNLSFGTNPVHTYASPDSYYVCHYAGILQAPGIQVCGDTICRWIYVDTVQYSSGCNALFFSNVSNNTVSFNNYSYGSGNWTCFWQFGDGTSTYDVSPFHIYAQSGSYEVCLSISDSTGCTDFYCDTLNVGQMSNNFFSFYGLVTCGVTNIAENGIAYLWTYDSLKPLIYDSTIVSQGFYTFDSIPSGEYLIRAELRDFDPLFGDYAPAYHGNSLFWDISDPINIQSNNQYFNINLAPLPGTGGPGSVSGSVQDMGFLGNLKVTDVIVYLLDLGADAVQYTTPDSLGNFSFSNIPYGLFKIYAELPGWNTSPIFVTIDQNNATHNGIDLLIGESDIVLNSTYASSMINGIDLYPNPVHSDLLYIDFRSGLTRTREIEIFDLHGRSLLMTISTDPKTRIDVSSLQPGIYTICIHDNLHIPLKQKILIPHSRH